MAQTVWILGAGASASFGAPLMEHFIDSADDLRRSDASSIDRPAFDEFFDALHEGFQRLHAKSSVNLRNIESVFGLVEMASLIGRVPGFSKEKLETLSRAVRMVLVQTIEQRGRFEYDLKKGQWIPPRAYLGLAAAFEKARQDGEHNPLAFITLNYDLGLDFALHWSSLEVDYGFGEPARGAVPLLKLHGSLNWNSCSACGILRVVDFPRILEGRGDPQPFGDPRTESGRVARAMPAGAALAALSPHCAGASRSSLPAIVPPSWNKTQYAKNFSRVWKRAADEISEATEIIVAGYSLPPSDSFFRDLLALSLAGPTRVRKIRVINMDARVTGMIRELLGPETRDRLAQEDNRFEDHVHVQFGHLPRVQVR